MTKSAFTSAEMLAKLVGFNTVSSNSNMELIEFVQEYLAEYGAESILLKDETGKKANLFGTIGPKDVEHGGFVLSGHTDVVPTEGQNWSTDPFVLTEKDGRLYGRGSSDMKGFIAVALAKLPEFAGRELKEPIHFAFSYDEEVGCIGARAIADHIKDAPFNPRICIVGEPTSMKPITGHKGVIDLSCVVTGHECHSSLAPYGANAVEASCELITYAKSVARRQASEGPFNNNFDPPFTTVHSGVIHGGTALNIVPNRCEFEIEIRDVPEADPAALAEEIRQYAWKKIEPALKDIDPKCGFNFTTYAEVPSFDIPNDHEAVELVQALSGANSAAKVSFATEAGLFQNAGIPTVVCGPGNIEQAHKPDEFVEIDQLRKCEVFMDRMLEKIAA